jgi:integrase
MARGYIRERKPGVFEIIYDIPREPGQDRKQKSVTVHRKNKKEAEKDLRKILHDIDNNNYSDPGKLTFAKYLGQWLKDYCKPKLTQNTYDSYANIVDNHVIPALGKHQLEKLKPLHLQEYYSQALEKKLSPKTVRYHHRVIHKALEMAVKWQIVTRNVADAVEPPKVGQYEAAVYCEDEAQKLLAAAEDTRLYIPILIALATGLRRGELLGLRWKDMDLKNNILTVNQTLLPNSEGLQFCAPKTKKSRRPVTLPASVVDTLKKHKAKQNEERLALGDTWDDNNLVVCREDGSPWHPATFSHNYKDLLSDNKLPHIRFHDLRHTHASILLRQGVHPKVVSERLGHSQIGITLDIYSHILPGIQEEVAQQLDNGLFNKAKNTQK